MFAFDTSIQKVSGLIAALVGALAVAGSAAAQTNVGVSISVGQPGFYGRVDIGNQPPPLIYPQPVIIQQSPVAVYQRPIYMRVPPGHYKNWARYCGQYRACGQPVYFVRDQDRRDAGPAWSPRGDERDDRHDHHDDDGGPGRGHGHGHGKGHGH